MLKMKFNKKKTPFSAAFLNGDIVLLMALDYFGYNRNTFGKSGVFQFPSYYL